MTEPENEICLDNDDHPNIDSEETEKCNHACLSAAGKNQSCSQCRIQRAKFCPDPLLKEIKKWINKLKSMMKEDCEDIIAQTILGIEAGIENFARSARFSTWAWSIFKNKLNDYRRQQVRGRGIVLTDEIFNFLRSLSPPSPVFTPDKINFLEELKNEYFNSPRALREAIESKIGQIEETEFKIIREHAIYVEKESISDQPAQDDISNMLNTLEELRPFDQSGCIELLLDVYYRQSQGETIRSIAQTKNMLPNTLTQQIGRCTRKINELLRDRGCL